MPPRGHVAGLNASNIIEGSRKRVRIDQNEATSAAASPSLVAATTPKQFLAAPTDAESVTRLGYKLLNVIYHARDTADADDPDTSLLVEPFLALPDADDYPDYYTIIKRPLTFEDVRTRLAQRSYASFEEAKHDCEVVCQNAKRYNQRETPIWLKARTLHSIIKDVYADLITAPEGTRSTQLDSQVPLLLDATPDGVQPMTSNPPSPVKAPAQAAAGDDGAPASTSNRRITLKRKPSKPALPRTPGPRGGTSSSSFSSSMEPEPTPGQEDVDMDAEGEPDIDADADAEADPDADADADADGPSSPATLTAADKRRRPYGRGKNLKSCMKHWYREIFSLGAEDGSGDRASVFFEELPSRDDYPDYYKLITQPVSLKEIEERVRTRTYQSPHAFFADVKLMISNAKWFNEEGSEIWRDADTIQRHVENKLIPAILADGFTLDPNDTRSSVLPPHMAGMAHSQSPHLGGRSLTPAGPSGTRVKLKLTGRSGGVPGSPDTAVVDDQQQQHLQGVASPSHWQTGSLPSTPQDQRHAFDPQPTASAAVLSPPATGAESPANFSASGRPIRSAVNRNPPPRAVQPMTSPQRGGSLAQSPPLGTRSPQKPTQQQLQMQQQQQHQLAPGQRPGDHLRPPLPPGPPTSGSTSPLQPRPGVPSLQHLPQGSPSVGANPFRAPSAQNSGLGLTPSRPGLNPPGATTTPMNGINARGYGPQPSHPLSRSTPHQSQPGQGRQGSGQGAAVRQIRRLPGPAPASAFAPAQALAPANRAPEADAGANGHAAAESEAPAHPQPSQSLTAIPAFVVLGKNFRKALPVSPVGVPAEAQGDREQDHPLKKTTRHSQAQAQAQAQRQAFDPVTATRQFVLCVGEGREEAHVLFRLRELDAAAVGAGDGGGDAQRQGRSDGDADAMDVDGAAEAPSASAADPAADTKGAVTPAPAYKPRISALLNGRRLKLAYLPLPSSPAYGPALEALVAQTQTQARSLRSVRARRGLRSGLRRRGGAGDGSSSEGEDEEEEGFDSQSESESEDEGEGEAEKDDAEKDDAEEKKEGKHAHKPNRTVVLSLPLQRGTNLLEVYLSPPPPTGPVPAEAGAGAGAGAGVEGGQAQAAASTAKAPWEGYRIWLVR